MQKTASESAVSPVVGVMLMLVVTIIIAAIVSAFAGSTAQTNNKAPQATIQGIVYLNGSGANLVKLTHAGGDELVTAKTQILIKKGEDWGPYVATLTGSPVVSNAKIHDTAGKFWINATDGGIDVPVWSPGETMFYDGGGFSSTDAGKSVDLEIATTDGKLISKSKMKIV